MPGYPTMVRPIGVRWLDSTGGNYCLTIKTGCPIGHTGGIYEVTGSIAGYCKRKSDSFCC